MTEHDNTTTGPERDPNDLTAGMELARDSILAIADGDEQRARALLAAGSHAEVTWAAATLLGNLRLAVLNQTKGDKRRASAALKNAVKGIDQDIVRAHIARTTKGTDL